MKILKIVALALSLAAVLLLAGILLTTEAPTVVNDMEVHVLGHIHSANCGHFQVS